MTIDKSSSVLDCKAKPSLPRKGAIKRDVAAPVNWP
jgi:hypothetical protein